MSMHLKFSFFQSKFLFPSNTLRFIAAKKIQDNVKIGEAFKECTQKTDTSNKHVKLKWLMR